MVPAPPELLLRWRPWHTMVDRRDAKERDGGNGVERN